MKSTKRDAKMWTKDDVRKVHKLWTSKTVEEIRKEMDIRREQLTYIITQMRKAGIEVPRKHRNGHMRNLLEELAHEING
jgi:hypothetical protein